MRLIHIAALIAGLLTTDVVWSRGKARYVPAPTPTPTMTATPLPTPTAVPTPGAQLIFVRNITGASAAEVKMIRAGEKLANQMIWTKCFEEWVLSARYTENKGLSQGQILLDKIRSIPTYIDVEMYYANNRTVGYEWYPFDGVVHMNRKFVFSVEMVADNLLHEDRGHSLEFFHDYNKSTSEPYGMNYAFEGCTHAMQQMQEFGFTKSKARIRAFKPKGLLIEMRKRKMPKPDQVPTGKKAAA